MHVCLILSKVGLVNVYISIFDFVAVVVPSFIFYFLHIYL